MEDPNASMQGDAEPSTPRQPESSHGGLAILAETAYPMSAPSARVRLASFIPYLRREGIDLEYSPTMGEEDYALISCTGSRIRQSKALVAASLRAARRIRDHDLLMVHRLRLLNPLPGYDPPRQLDVYDFDDAIFLGLTTTANRRFSWLKQESRRWTEYIKRSNLVIAGNSFLADQARNYADHVEVIPSCVNPQQQESRIHEDREIVTLGWIGSPTTSSYLSEVLPAIRRINSSDLRVKLILIGADRRIRAPWIEHREWSPARESREVAKFDVGLMPLPNTDWARGKCGYKLLQYFAAGVPAIASPVGVNIGLIGEERGFLASSQFEWRQAIEWLAANPQERRLRGAAGQSFVQKYYSYDSWAPRLAEILRSVAR